MRRDMDLVRTILGKTADAPLWFRVNDLTIEGYNNQQIAYHVHIMGQGGLLDIIEDSYYDGNRDIIVNGLTWLGQEHLAAYGNNTIWAKVKERLLAHGISATFSILKEIAEGLSRQYLLQNLP